jgi:hypothetical protein
MMMGCLSAGSLDFAGQVGKIRAIDVGLLKKPGTDIGYVRRSNHAASRSRRLSRKASTLMPM